MGLVLQPARERKQAGLEDVRIRPPARFTSRALALGEGLPMIGKLSAHPGADYRSLRASGAGVGEGVAIADSDNLGADILKKDVVTNSLCFGHGSS